MPKEPTGVGAVISRPPAVVIRAASAAASGVAKYTVQTVGIRPSPLGTRAATSSPWWRAHTSVPGGPDPSPKVQPNSSP